MTATDLRISTYEDFVEDLEAAWGPVWPLLRQLLPPGTVLDLVPRLYERFQAFTSHILPETIMIVRFTEDEAAPVLAHEGLHVALLRLGETEGNERLDNVPSL